LRLSLVVMCTGRMIFENVDRSGPYSFELHYDTVLEKGRVDKFRYNSGNIDRELGSQSLCGPCLSRAKAPLAEKISPSVCLSLSVTTNSLPRVSSWFGFAPPDIFVAIKVPPVLLGQNRTLKILSGGTLLLPLEERFDSLPRGVRQIRAAGRGSGSLGAVSTRQDAGD